jgi:alpha-L-glutamate ligase-like protein
MKQQGDNSKIQMNFDGINLRKSSVMTKLKSRRNSYFTNDKLIVKDVLELNEIPIPKTYFTIDTLSEIDAKISLLEQMNDFVVKPSNGFGGKGILILKRNEGNQWQSNTGELYDRKALVLHLEKIIFGRFSKESFDKVIVEYRLRSHSDFQKIFKRGIADLRIIFLNAYPIVGMLLMPTERSKGRSNLNDGAIGMGVDLQTGRLTRGYDQSTDQMVSRHPDSNFLFEGMKLPHWEKTMAMSVAAAKIFSLSYVGIDIVFDERMGPLVMKINSRRGKQCQNFNFDIF